MNNHKKKIRVLHLLEHLEVGGAEKLIVDLINTFDAERVESTICLYRSMGAFAEEIDRSGTRVVFLPKEAITAHWRSIPFLLALPFIAVESCWFILRLAMLLRKEKFDLVHSHMFSANLWSNLAAVLGGRPATVITEHNIKLGRHSFKHRLFIPLIYTLSTRIVAVSQAVADNLIKPDDAAARKLVVIQNGIETSAFEKKLRRNPPQSPPELPGQGFPILLVARLVPQKNIDLFLHAMQICCKQHPDFCVWIAGDGPEKQRLETLAGDLGIADRLFFLGRRLDIPELLNHAGLLVNSSDKEGFPVSLLEAMAAGLPIVATDVGGTGEIVEHGETGYLVRAGDKNGLAEAVLTMLDNPELAAAMGTKGREKVNTYFTRQRIAGLWQELYGEIIDE